MTKLLPLVVILSFLLVSCGLFGGTVNPRAAEYYNCLSGVNIKVHFASFLSPAYQKAMEPGDLARLNKAYSNAQEPNTHFSKVQPKDVFVSQAGRFAYTVVRADLGRPYKSMSPVRWVKVGAKWYVYLNTQKEVAAYGYFPQELQPPSAIAGGAAVAPEGKEPASQAPKPEDEKAFGGDKAPAEPANPPAKQDSSETKGGDDTGGGSSGVEPLPVPGHPT